LRAIVSNRRSIIDFGLQKAPETKKFGANLAFFARIESKDETVGWKIGCRLSVTTTD